MKQITFKDIYTIGNIVAENELYHNRWIGGHIQGFVMDSFPDKTIILVADGEDTPREMYKKQNYQYVGFRYETQKIYQT